jgi:hypothetical protein
MLDGERQLFVEQLSRLEFDPAEQSRNGSVIQRKRQVMRVLQISAVCHRRPLRQHVARLRIGHDHS